MTLSNTGFSAELSSEQQKTKLKKTNSLALGASITAPGSSLHNQAEGFSAVELWGVWLVANYR